MASRFEVEPLIWKAEGGFLDWFSSAWKPGEHLSVIAPTGAGKTTFVGGLLELRRYVLALDAKGGDSSLARLGYPRLSEWPGEKRLGAMVAKNDEEGRPSRYLVGGKVTRHEENESLRSTTKAAMDDAFSMGGWTLYADELGIISDPRLFNLRKEADRLLIAARDRGLSFVSSYQAPSWVTPQAARQSTWIAVSYTRDREVVDRLSEILGRPKPEIRGAIEGLDRFSWLIVGRNPREPIRVTIPDELKGPR